MQNNVSNKVSIVCTTYNQSKYIAKALDSFLMQKTNFHFVVYVGDDCSTDGTREIVEDYAKKYPDIIKPIFQPVNTGGYGNVVTTFSQVNTEYVAWCEGDDYWTDPYKLQIQFDFMEKNKDCSVSFHYVEVRYEGNERENSIYPSKSTMLGRNEIKLEELLKSNYIQTNSVMYRWRFKNDEFKQAFPPYLLPGDWYIHLLHAKVGKVCFIPEVMSVYRRQPSGIWYDAISNFDKHILDYGICKAIFYFNVYKNIADESKKYLDEEFIPSLQQILEIYFTYAKFDKLIEIKNLYPKFVELALEKHKSKGNIVIQKCNKYKKLFNIFLYCFLFSIVSIIFFVLFFWLRN